MKNYYEILEVSEKASTEVIEKAYKTLAKKYHPDKNSQDKTVKEKKMKELNEAYAVLSSEFLREQYDRELNNVEGSSINKNSKQVNWNKKKDKKSIDVNDEETFANTTTFENLVKISKNIFSKRPSLKSIKEFIKRDYLSIGLTIIIMLMLLIIMWFIPFTKTFVQQILDIF